MSPTCFIPCLNHSACFLTAKPHVDVLDIDDEEEENDGMGANMPLNTGDGSSASTGARSSTNSRQNMLEHQREVQKNKMRNRMAGGKKFSD